MKKYLPTILLGAFGVMAIVAPVLAATSVSFAPVNVSVRQGETFTLTIGVNPQGVKNYTAKAELRYPADLLEVKSFAFANGWTALSQPGYDLTDNTNGVFIKTAGYPGGVSSPVIFGTVSFSAKKSGNGTITLNNNSFALDADNKNVLADASVQTAVAVSVPVVPVQTTQTTPKTSIVPTTSIAPVTVPTVPKEEKQTVEIKQETPIVQEQPAVLQPIASPSLLASVATVVTLGTNSAIVGILVTIMILAFVGYSIYAIIQNTRRKDLGKL